VTAPARPSARPKAAVPVYARTSNSGYYVGEVSDRQHLLGQFNATIGEWVKGMKLSKDDRAQLMIMVEDDGHVMTLGEVLGDLGERDALREVETAYAKAESAKEVMIVWPHLNLYSEAARLAVKGRAANGPHFRSVEEDKAEFRTFFDFVPHPADTVVPLMPYMGEASSP
jgi:hypothetical protein